MGKILETTYHTTVENLTSFYGTLLQNSFYTINDRKPTIVTYYNINTDYSALDPGAKIAYDNVGVETPLRFNRIYDFILYGINRIELQSELDEFGYETNPITGECFVLPNTIKPTEGDYFEIEHITDSTWLFIVTDVQQDTLENGSNVYKLAYRLEHVDHDRLLHDIVGNYRMIEEREGTNVVKIVKNESYNTAKELDKVAVTLKSYYNELFYNEKVQTFTFMDLTEWRIYDPFMIEFLIHNEILANGNDSYIHVAHQLYTNKTFAIDYDRSMFKAFEDADVDKLKKSKRVIQVKEITSYGTTFSSRYEPYFEAVYSKPPVSFSGVCIPDNLCFNIFDHTLIKDDSDCECPLFTNILVKHFYDEEITKSELDSIMDFHFDDSRTAFYIIPLLILCLETAIKKALNRTL